MKIHAILEVDMSSEAVNGIINVMLTNMPLVLGCIDDTACNYNLEATSDDGSCEYAAVGCLCSSSDNDNDGICNEVDICPNNWDPYQNDHDQDGSADACDDDDDDDDGLIDCWNFWYDPQDGDVDGDGVADNFGIECNDAALGIDLTPSSIELLHSFPNPFNPSSTISFNISYPQKINLSIYNIYGAKVETLSNKFYNQGYHQVKWSPNKSIGSGLYFIRLETPNSQINHKMLYLK